MTGDEMCTQVSSTNCLPQEVELFIVAIRADLWCTGDVSARLVFCITFYAFKLPIEIIETVRHIPEWWGDGRSDALIKCVELIAGDKVAYRCADGPRRMNGGHAPEVVHFILSGNC